MNKLTINAGGRRSPVQAAVPAPPIRRAAIPPRVPLQPAPAPARAAAAARWVTRPPIWSMSNQLRVTEDAVDPQQASELLLFYHKDSPMLVSIQMTEQAVKLGAPCMHGSRLT